MARISKHKKAKPTAKVLVLFGTRPEAIKLAPVISELRKIPHFKTIVVSSSQHTDLLKPFLKIFQIETDYDLQVMKNNQTPNQVLAKTIESLDKILESENPDLLLIQGDTTTTLAGALAGFNRQMVVGHIEAGLRSGDTNSPFPEEMNRRLVSKVATLHFAATVQNRQNLVKESVPENQIFVTGNTIIDSLNEIRKNHKPSQTIQNDLKQTGSLKKILLTTHRRESFGKTMRENLEVLRDFVEKRKDTCLIFPVHLNPNVQKVTNEILGKCERIYLLEPLSYVDFLYVMENAWLIVSDSGGVQEEAPSMGKPVLILRENTERPEAVLCGVAKLVGGNPLALARLLEDNYLTQTWIDSVKQVQNPFGDGKSAARIANILEAISNQKNNG
ncbi:MAG: UDP-N-acetylglucosamine 2-epimerase (non-hydrolyzing) [Acidobacteriota bacterium]|nr:UDP-N-acetylglucosamine 2-epimerase (non-hydrolyzing) [Acidobacteriota bacterium]